MLEVTMTHEPTVQPRVFDRIVCGIDESAAALEAARQAERLRDPLGSLHLAAITEVSTAVHAGWAMAQVLAELDATARHALHEAIDAVHPASADLVTGDPMRALLDQIGDHGATLVAVGSGGHRRAVGMLLGTVGTRLLHEAPCSVLIARKARGPKAFPSSVLVGVDGSQESLAAARVAKGIAGRFDAELLGVTATGGKEVDLPAAGRSTPLHLEDSRSPVDALADLAAEVDLLVVGSRGLHGPRALGSVSERVAHRAPCSVLVVRSD